MTAGIEIDAVTKHFGPFRALVSVSLSIPPGAFFTLLGPSGCGKTTLLRLIAGFEHPGAGAIRLDGADITALPPNRRPVNMVFQSYALFPHMTVAQNIAFGLEMLDRPRAEARARAAEMMRLVKLEALSERLPAQLSGGQQQRVALARALAPAPRVLLLDEPLSALDLTLRREMQSELRRLKAETGVTFLFVTHDQEEALSMSDAIAVMEAGRVRQVGAPREIYERPADRFVAGFIGATSLLEGRARASADGRLEIEIAGGAVIEASGDASPGARVTVAVRPEHVRLRPDGALVGVVRELVYTGAQTQARIALEGGAELLARLDGAAAPPEPGARVGAEISPGKARALAS